MGAISRVFIADIECTRIDIIAVFHHPEAISVVALIEICAQVAVIAVSFYGDGDTASFVRVANRRGAVVSIRGTFHIGAGAKASRTHVIFSAEIPVVAGVGHRCKLATDPLYAGIGGAFVQVVTIDGKS